MTVADIPVRTALVSVTEGDDARLDETSEMSEVATALVRASGTIRVTARLMELDCCSRRAASLRPAVLSVEVQLATETSGQALFSASSCSCASADGSESMAAVTSRVKALVSTVWTTASSAFRPCTESKAAWARR